MKILREGGEIPFWWSFHCGFQVLERKIDLHPDIPYWSHSFKVMCDASGTTLSVVLGKNYNKLFYVICYARKTLNSTQCNYNVTDVLGILAMY